MHSRVRKRNLEESERQSRSGRERMTGVCAQGGGVLFAPRSHYLYLPTPTSTSHHSYLPHVLPPTTYLPTSRTTVLTLVSTTTFANLSLPPPLTCSFQMTDLSIMGTTSSIHDLTLPHLPHYLTIAAYLIHTACTQAATVLAESSSCFCRGRDVKCLHT